MIHHYPSQLPKDARKIVIIGNAGSGKTTLALQLHHKLKLPLHHLDQHYWLPNWQRQNIETFIEAHDKLCDTDEWIIEGSYTKFLYRRMVPADVIIFLDMPRLRCIRNVIKRSITHHRTVIPGNPEGCSQRIFSFEFLSFLKWTWNYNNRTRHTIMHLLHEDEFASKQIYILNSPQMIADFMKQL